MSSPYMYKYLWGICSILGIDKKFNPLIVPFYIDVYMSNIYVTFMSF